MNRLERIVAVGLLGIPLALGIPGCKGYEEKRDPAMTQAVIEDDSLLRDTILSYLANPRFAGSDFMQQITGTKAKLRMLDLSEGMVYFSIQEKDYERSILADLSKDYRSIEFGKDRSGEFMGDALYLGDYVLRSPGSYFFRFKADDFKVSRDDTITKRYRTAEYSIDMKELQDFLSNESIYGGYLNINTGTDRTGRVRTISNHGAFVAMKEDSLERLVRSITAGDDSKEKKAQKILDFVTEEIRYDHEEASSDIEVLKRPNEVLMTGSSDCSGKVILYASLLEQADIDYRLVYLNTHIAVAVQGDFPSSNGLGFKIGDKSFSIAETTARGFKIGKSRLQGGFQPRDIRYIQRPGPESKVYDAKTGKPVPFL